VLEQLELQPSDLEADARTSPDRSAAQMAAAQPEAEQPNVEMRSFARRAPEHPPFTDVVVPMRPKDVGCTKRAERHGRVEFEGHGRIEPRLAAWIAHGRGAS
jgi:hypothetical protein